MAALTRAEFPVDRGVTLTLTTEAGANGPVLTGGLYEARDRGNYRLAAHARGPRVVVDDNRLWIDGVRFDLGPQRDEVIAHLKRIGIAYRVRAPVSP